MQSKISMWCKQKGHQGSNDNVQEIENDTEQNQPSTSKSLSVKPSGGPSSSSSSEPTTSKVTTQPTTSKKPTQPTTNKKPTQPKTSKVPMPSGKSHTSQVLKNKFVSTTWLKNICPLL